MFKKNRVHVAVLTALAAAGTSGGYAPQAQAQQGAARTVDEILVTATRREQSTQDVPISVQALDSTALDQRGIATFSDYLKELPSVTAGGSGPAQNTLYIRGVASTTPHLATATVAGITPNVAFYLDDQPLAQPGRNLDIYAADLSRIEVLSGPQGTLFGGSAQAGTVRLITNKPNPSDVEARIKLGLNAISEGGDGSNIEAMLNLPLTERFTFRGVVYRDHQAGWIDNVQGSLSARDSARFRAEGDVRANGLPVSAIRAGKQAGADLSGVTFLEADNSHLVEDNYNDAEYSGGRFTGLYEFNEDWRLTVAHTAQRIKSDGVFAADPELGDYKISRFSDEFIDDELGSTSWTLEGRLGNLEAIYTGAYTSRETDQVIDYSDYIFIAQYMPYYVCDTSVSYPGEGMDPAGTCYSPESLVDSQSEARTETHEVRFSTNFDLPIRATFGAFTSDTVLKELNDFTHINSTEINNGRGFAPNRAFVTGHVSSLDPFPQGVIFRNDIRRTDQQFGLFTEVDWDINDQYTMTVGVRYYDVEVDLNGSANSSFCNRVTETGGTDVNAFGTDITDLYNGDGQYTFINACPGDDVPYFGRTFTAADLPNLNELVANDDHRRIIRGGLEAPNIAKSDGIIGKVSISYDVNDDVMLYATWSQGFRPGLLNRPGGRISNDGEFVVPYVVDTDDVSNYEFGWKMDLLDDTLRFNASMFSVDIGNLQTTIFDPNVTNLLFSDNAADANVLGFEGNFTYLPEFLQGLTFSGAFSLLNSEITQVITPTNDVLKGDDLAFAPKLQTNFNARYEWSVGGGLVAHVTPHFTYSKHSYSDIITINRDQIDSWLLMGVNFGLTSQDWMAEVYVENLADKQAELARNFFFDVERVTYARPRTLGLRVIYDF